MVQIAFLEVKICAPRTFMVGMNGTTLISRLTKGQVQGGIIGDGHYFNFSKCDEKRGREPVTGRKERWQ